MLSTSASLIPKAISSRVYRSFLSLVATKLTASKLAFKIGGKLMLRFCNCAFLLTLTVDVLAKAVFFVRSRTLPDTSDWVRLADRCSVSERVFEELFIGRMRVP